VAYLKKAVKEIADFKGERGTVAYLKKAVKEIADFKGERLLKSHRTPPTADEKCERCGKFHKSEELYRCTECGVFLCLDQVWSWLGQPVGEQVYHDVFDRESMRITPSAPVVGGDYRLVITRQPPKIERVRRCGPCERVYR